MTFKYLGYEVTITAKDSLGIETPEQATQYIFEAICMAMDTAADMYQQQRLKNAAASCREISEAMEKAR